MSPEKSNQCPSSSKGCIRTFDLRRRHVFSNPCLCVLSSALICRTTYSWDADLQIFPFLPIRATCRRFFVPHPCSKCCETCYTSLFRTNHKQLGPIHLAPGVDRLISSVSTVPRTIRPLPELLSRLFGMCVCAPGAKAYSLLDKLEHYCMLHGGGGAGQSLQAYIRSAKSAVLLLSRSIHKTILLGAPII